MENQKMNIYEKINEVKLKLQNLNLKKSGKNNFSNYDYFELQDFLPSILELCKEQKIYTQVSFNKEEASLTIFDCESDELVVITSPMADATVLNKDGKKSMPDIQSLGAAQTYQRRYLFMATFDIVEVDFLDKETGKPETKSENKHAKKDFPKTDKAWLNPKTPEWDKAIEYLKTSDGTIDAIKKKYMLSKVNETKLMEEAI